MNTAYMGQKHTLTLHNPTRWNNESECVGSHLSFRPEVEALTGQSSNKLGAFRLSILQWKIAEQLQELLLLFRGPTLLFSQKELPLISDVLTILENLELSLQAARDDKSAPACIRIAAQAGLFMIRKYLGLFDDCEVYAIAIGTLHYTLLLYGC